MFTGIVSAVGRVTEVQINANERVLRVSTPYSDTELGESIAVNGVCLTVTERDARGQLQFYASSETCGRTNLGELATGSKINLERALRLADRLSGHLVQGHVDGQARLVAIRPSGESHEIEVALPQEFGRYVIEKGSITLDGISLTVNSVTNSMISLMIIPHTWQNTVLHTKQVGQNFNVELDMVAKYVEKMAVHYGKNC